MQLQIDIGQGGVLPYFKSFRRIESLFKSLGLEKGGHPFVFPFPLDSQRPIDLADGGENAEQPLFDPAGQLDLVRYFMVVLDGQQAEEVVLFVGIGHHLTHQFFQPGPDADVGRGQDRVRPFLDDGG